MLAEILNKLNLVLKNLLLKLLENYNAASFRHLNISKLICAVYIYLKYVANLHIMLNNVNCCLLLLTIDYENKTVFRRLR